MFVIFMCLLLALGASNDSIRKLVDCSPESANLFYDRVNCVNLLTFLASTEVETTYSNEGVSVSITYPEPQESSISNQLILFLFEPFFAFESSSSAGDSNSISISMSYEYNPTIQIPIMKLLRYYKVPGDQFFNLKDLFPGFDEKYPVPEIKLEIEGPSEINIDCPPSLVTYTVNLEEYMQNDESKYTWDVYGDTVSDSLKSEVQAQSGLILEVDSSNLVEGTYYFVVTVDSYYDLQFFDSYTVEVKSIDSVTVNLTPQSPYIITSQQDLDIEASIEIVCEDYDTAFTWEYTSSSTFNRRLEYYSDPSDVITNSQQPSNVLDINAGNLEPGYFYVFTLTVVHGPITTSFGVDVLVDFADPVADIDLVDSVFYNFQDLELDGSCSFDVDSPEEDDRLSFAWTCEEEGGDCIGSDGLAFDLTGETESVLEISKDLLRVDAVYTFTLTVTSLFGKTASESVTLTIKEIVQADFIINSDRDFSISIEVEGQVESAEWTQVFGTNIGEDRRRLDQRELWHRGNNGPNKIQLELTGENIPKGEYFGYQVDYVTDEGCGKQFVFFYMNDKPTCSGISVLPAGDDYTISIDGCTDSDAPILYTLKVYRGRSRDILLDRREDNSITTELDAGSYNIKATICDAYDLCIEITDSVDAARRMLRQSSRF